MTVWHGVIAENDGALAATALIYASLLVINNELWEKKVSW